ncbi:MAG: DNA primase, partial [Nitrosopumilus sp.]
MQAAEINFLEDSFKKYYFEHFDRIRVPERTSEREFGFQKFNSGMTRHLQIKDDKELHLLFMQNVPSDVYCSNAYYTFPNLPMNEK